MSWKKKLRKAYQEENRVEKDDGALSKHLGIATRDRPKKYHDVPKIAFRVALTTMLLVVIGGPIGIFLAMHTKVQENQVALKKQYDGARLAALREATVKALNHVEYADHDFRREPIATEAVDAVNAFAASLHAQMEEGETYLYSPLTAYLNLDLLSLGATSNVKGDLLAALGSDALRGQAIPKTIDTNFYTGEKGSSHIYQGAFFHQEATLQEGYVDKLTSRRVEAYSLDMDKDLSAIPAWANDKAGAKMLEVKDLDYHPGETLAYWLSLLDFEGKWSTSYNDSKTQQKTFTRLNGSTFKMPFMTHEVAFLKSAPDLGTHHGVYDYGDYISAYDYYHNGYTIQYLTPKERGKNIFDLVHGKDIFIEDETKSLAEELDKQYTYTVTFVVPKFNASSFLDLTPKVKAMGLSSLYEDLHNSISGAIDLTPYPYGGAVAFTKQYNTVEFSETGTVARSLAFSGGYGATMARPGQSYVITLDEAFLYVIRDPNGLPMFVGAYNG